MSAPTRLDAFGRALDRALGVLFPGVEAKRLGARAVAGIRRDHAERQYAAAKVTGSTGAWTPVNYQVNDVIGTSLTRLQARVRQLVRDMPHFARAVNLGADYTVGQGIQVKPRVIDRSGKKPALDRETNRKIEDFWRRWCDEADMAGFLCFAEIERLAKRQDLEVGEFLIVKRIPKRSDRYLPFALELVEPDALNGGGALYGNNSAGDNEVILGVEVDRLTYERVAYHFQDQTTPFASYRVAAENVIHGFESLRPKQLRGVTPFAPGVLTAHNLRDYLDAEIDGAKMAARWLAFVQTPDAAGTMAAMGAQTDAANRRTEEIGYAIKEYLLPGEQVEIASHNRPGNGFDPFTQFVLRTFAIVAGFPYELLTGDYRGLNYTTIRGSRNDLAMTLRPVQKRHVRQFTQRVYREALDYGVLTGRLDLPGYWKDPLRYQAAYFIPPGQAPIDPLREGKAQAEAIRTGLLSPQEAILERGRDPADVLDDLDAWHEEVAAREIPLDAAPAAVKTNPAALGAAEETDED